MCESVDVDHDLSDSEPVGSTVHGRLRGSRRARIIAAVGTAVALAGVAAWASAGGGAGGASGAAPGTGQTREAFAALTLTCPGGNTNSGSPDGDGRTAAQVSPLTQARTWARADFAARFPAASPRAVDYNDGTVVLFREGDRLLRAALLYARTDSAWALTELKYC
jgi:hypothetical protein